VQDNERSVTLTREELYARVWQVPISRLAVQYGITGNGLAKICDRLKIPYPPRGYWAKEAAGKRVVTFKLPPVTDNTPQSVTIRPTPPSARPPELPAEVKKKADAARVATSAVTVPKRLARPHPIVAGWLADRERRKQEAKRERDPWRRKMLDPDELTESERRQHRILDALFKALERQGAKVKLSERRELSAEIQHERIEFQIREKQKQVRRPLTDEEKRWSFSNDKGWKQELQPTGKLVFAIRTDLPGGLRTEWLETDDRAMEMLLPDIVATFVAAGPLLVEQRRQREEAEHQRRIAEQKRYEEEQRRKRDNNRWRRFMDIAHQWRDAEIARGFLDALKKTRADLDREVDGRSVRDWITWAEERLRSADPLNNGAEAILNSVASVTEWTYRD
jgi:hypothetical protein